MPARELDFWEGSWSLGSQLDPEMELLISAAVSLEHWMNFKPEVTLSQGLTLSTSRQ